MDSLSSSSTTTSSTATVPKSASKQLTYTTAGTLYKPASSQPLQPPTRRGRSFKWASGGATSNLALLPKSFIATLPLKSGANRTPTSQQYTPLQQNYDRAIGPLGELGHVSVNMSAKPSLMLSSNAHSSEYSLFSDLDREKYAEDSSESSDSDSDFGMDPLMNMTVKSLHNLASYPNPSQKKARKVLLRGVKPALDGLPAAPKTNPPPVPLARSFGPPEILKRGAASPISLRPIRSDPLLLQKVEDDTAPKPDLDQSSTFQRGNPQQIDQSDKTSSSLSGSTSASTTLAFGSGPPQPLTAGPPGQRQYRPSTFESTFKALKTKQQSQKSNQDMENGELALSPHTLLQAGIDDVGLLTDPISVSKLSEPPAVEAHVMASPKKMDLPTRDMPAAAHDQPFNGFSWYSGRAYCNSVHWSPCGYWSAGPYHFNQSLALPTSQRRYKPGTDRLTEDEITARNEKINREWYAGAGLLGKEPNEVMAAGHWKKPEKPFGVIGDGRPNKAKMQHSLMKITDANKMTTAEHAKPLMGIAYASVLRHVQADLCDVDWSQMEMHAEEPGDQAYGHLGGQSN